MTNSTNKTANIMNLIKVEKWTGVVIDIDTASITLMLFESGDPDETPRFTAEIKSNVLTDAELEKTDIGSCIDLAITRNTNEVFDLEAKLQQTQTVTLTPSELEKRINELDDLFNDIDWKSGKQGQ